jgi:hypothetical protein
MKHSTSSRLFLLLTSALALSLIAPARIHLLSWGQAGLSSTAYPSSLQHTGGSLEADLNDDGQLEQVALHNGTAVIKRNAVSLWGSPPDWQVRQAQITDLDHDGDPEVALLIWRDFAPWPIDKYLVYPGRIQDFHDRQERSCHLIMIGWRRQVFTEIWAGSALVDPLIAFTTADLDHDQRQELIALEGRYDHSYRIGQSVTVWEWNGFGFSLLSRGPQGRFYDLITVRSPSGSDLLLIQGIFWR